MSLPSETSIAAWRKINDRGLLDGLQLKVYNAVYQEYERCGPATRNELNKLLEEPDSERSPDVYNRLSELRRRRAIDVVGKRVCKVTGNICQVWAPTGELPEDLQARVAKPKDADLRRAWEELKTATLLAYDRGFVPGPEFHQMVQWLFQSVADVE